MTLPRSTTSRSRPGNPGPGLRACIGGLVALVAVGLVAPALAQNAGTGAMIVRVLDPDDRPLPGASVLVQGPTGTRNGFTDLGGNARFPGLYPADYAVTVSLDGFQAVRREQLRITVGRTISVTVTLQLSSVEETITVTGESPVVDVKGTRVGSLYTDELIDKTPTASGIWAGVLDHVPGVVLEDIDVGGGESGQQSRFRAYGSQGEQTVWNINGANNTDVGSLGSTAAYVSTASFEEVGVTTAAHDIEMQGAGVALNMVTKSGSNDWNFSTKYFYENEDLVGNNVDQELMDREVSEGNPNTLLSDLDLQAGGPLLRDRAWFFVDYWNFKVERRIIGLEEGEVDDTSLEDWTLNGTVQLTDDHKLTARYLTNRKFRGNRLAGRTRPAASAFIQDSFVDIAQVEWQGVLGSDTFASVIVNRHDNDFPLLAKDADSPEPHPDFPDTAPTFEFATGAWSGQPQQESFNGNDRNSVSGTVTHYLASERQSHDIKVGGDVARLQEFDIDTVPFGLWQLKFRDVPIRIRFFNSDTRDVLDIDPPEGEVNRSTSLALFGQNSWTLANRVTVTGGIRWDWSNNYYPDQVRGESFFPERGSLFQQETLPGREDITVWSDISPRIGIVYDLFGDGRTALKANYARYSETQGVFWASRLNAADIGFEEWFWTDSNGDGQFQLGEETALRRASFPGVTESIDPDFASPLTDEFSVGAEHELFDDFLLSTRYIHRDRKNNIEELNLGVPYGPIAETLGVPDSYTPVQVRDPGPDGVLGTADDGDLLTIFSQDPATFGNDDFLITNPERFGFEQDWGYDGLEIVAQKRWSNNWQVLASYNFGTAIIFDDVGDSPNEDIGRNGVRSSFDRPHMFKITGNYLFPDPIGVNLGAFVRFQSGQGRIRSANFDEDDGLAQGAETIRVAARREDTIGPDAEDPLYLMDLRAEKQFTLGDYGVLHAYLDIFNVFNVNTVTSQNGLSGPNFDRIFAIVPPRVFRVGAAWDF